MIEFTNLEASGRNLMKDLVYCMVVYCMARMVSCSTIYHIPSANVTVGTNLGMTRRSSIYHLNLVSLIGQSESVI